MRTTSGPSFPESENVLPGNPFTMPTETLTLTKALVELKLLTKRIEKRLESLEPVAMKKGTKFETAVKSQADFERDARATWQALNDLMTRRRKIKTALVMANATTTVEIAGETMTIAEAIEKKNMLDTEQDIVQHMRAKLVEAQNKVDRHNREMEVKLMKLLEATYAKKETQVSKDDYDRIAIPFLESNEGKLVDPLNCEKTAVKMEDRFSDFFAEVDVCLSIANATTEITIS